MALRNSKRAAHGEPFGERSGGKRARPGYEESPGLEHTDSGAIRRLTSTTGADSSRGTARSVYLPLVPLSLRPAVADLAVASSASTPTTPKWTKDETLWCRYYYLLLFHAFRSSSPPRRAPRATEICAWFNAYFSGFMTTGKNPVPRHSRRAFADFHRETRSRQQKIVEQVEAISAEHKRAGVREVYKPVVTPAQLKEFTDLHDESDVDGDFDKVTQFLERITHGHFHPIEPSSVADGRTNILRRLPLDLSGYTARHKFEFEVQPCGIRHRWHADELYNIRPGDVVHAPLGKDGKRKPHRWSNRSTHSTTGNALLNMAIIRPHDYDGDSNALMRDVDTVGGPEMSEEQREHIQAVRTGDALRNRVFAQGIWPPEPGEWDEAAGVQTDLG